MELAILEKIARSREEKAVVHQLRGAAASSGVASGRCIIVKGLNDLDRLEDGAVAICEKASPDLIPFIPRLAGLATERGGRLASLLTYAREHNIPAVVGVKGLMERAREGETIWVDGECGTVYSTAF
ncbi:MAG: PEP-utilizing enzyme [Syntrophorhabdales bacterium]|jgi:pyruvate,water dikinase